MGMLMRAGKNGKDILNIINAMLFDGMYNRGMLSVSGQKPICNGSTGSFKQNQRKQRNIGKNRRLKVSRCKG